MDPLETHLNEHGFRLLGAQNPDPFLKDKPLDIDLFNNYPIDEEVRAVVVGHDVFINYTKISLASLYIQ